MMNPKATGRSPGFALESDLQAVLESSLEAGPRRRPKSAVQIAERVRAIELLVLDADGVLTDGRIVYTDGGEEVQAFDVRDGSGLALWRRAGHRAAVITGRGCAALERRAKEVGLDPVIQRSADKSAAFVDLLGRCGVEPHRACAVGDDWPDLPVLRRAGVAVAVADACPEVRAAADYVTAATGGRGAVREVVEWILKAQGRWRELVNTGA